MAVSVRQCAIEPGQSIEDSRAFETGTIAYTANRKLLIHANSNIKSKGVGVSSALVEFGGERVGKRTRSSIRSSYGRISST